jgi:hypothetical protein
MGLANESVAKGLWAFGGSYDRRGLGLIKPGIPNRNQGQGRSGEQTIHRRGVCAPALEPRGGGEGSSTKCQGFKPYLGNPAVRHYRGASGNAVMVEL